jgi:hypothetical protein
MNAMTCHEVETQLDLLAAGECDRPTRRAVESHLDHCAACAASFAESQRLLGLLDRHWDETGPDRVRQRIEQDERQARRRYVVLPIVRRAAALAALFLVTLGLALWLPPSTKEATQPELQLAALEIHDREAMKMAPEIAVRVMDHHETRFKEPKVEVLTITLAPGQSGEAFREELRRAQSIGKLPLPTVVPLMLTLTNVGERPVELRFTDAGTELSLDVRGTSVVRLTANGAAEPTFFHPPPLRLAPGGVSTFRIDRLIAGTRGRLQYIYLTEPGEYDLAVRLQATVDGRSATVTSRTVRINVRK